MSWLRGTAYGATIGGAITPGFGLFGLGSSVAFPPASTLTSSLITAGAFAAVGAALGGVLGGFSGWSDQKALEEGLTRRILVSTAKSTSLAGTLGTVGGALLGGACGILFVDHAAALPGALIGGGWIGGLCAVGGSIYGWCNDEK